jgi:valyl-tRNA synthetase
VLDPARHERLFPADIRPQSHEIIRTWAFYTIAKALLHENEVPWHDVVVSGWILDPDRKKMSKSKGNVVTPVHLVDEYGADAVRYWAASARLGTDTAFDEKVMKIGKRLVTKLFNAGKFVLGQGAPEAPITSELDRAFVERLRALVAKVTANFDAFEYAHALQETETFFWRDFTDTYLELVKVRARGGDAAAGSAVATLRLGLRTLLRMFAPVLPYVTEEVWSWAFAAETRTPSIHQAAWPAAADFAAVQAPADAASFDVAVACLAAVNKNKSESGVSVGRGIRTLTVATNPATRSRLDRVAADVMAAARAERWDVAADAGAADGAFRIAAVEFAEQEA